MTISKATTGFGGVRSPADRAETAGAVSIACHDYAVPSFVEAELERLYGSLFSSLAHYRVYGGAENASTYTVHVRGKLTTVFLFRRAGDTVHVINEWIKVDEGDAQRFADYIFARFDAVRIITFHAVETGFDKLAYPYRRYNCTEDAVLTLPPTAEQYVAGLGKATRKNWRRYFKKLMHDFPSFAYRIYERDEVDEEHMRRIIALNRLRMANRNKVSAFTDSAAEKIFRLAKARGFVMVATIDGRICAGSIAYRVGTGYFSWVKAHDPAYDEYRLGLICACLTIFESIARKGKEYHLMWGREEHKALLNSVQRSFDHLTIYRSSAQLLWHADILLKDAWAGYARRCRLRLLAAQGSNNGAARLVSMGLRMLRSLKRFAARHGLWTDA